MRNHIRVLPRTDFKKIVRELTEPQFFDTLG